MKKKLDIDIDRVLILGQRMGFFKEKNNAYFLSGNSRKCQLYALQKPLEEFIKNEYNVKDFLKLIGNPSSSEKELDQRILEYTINEKEYSKNRFSKFMRDNFENVKGVSLSTGQAPPVVILGVGFLLREMYIDKNYIKCENGYWSSTVS